MTDILTMMLVVGLILSFAILGIFIWGAKQGQFDDGEKMMSGLLFDSQEDLNDAIKKENKIKEAKNNKSK
jgi:cbb3-type cytochrome oxidase maturation protein